MTDNNTRPIRRALISVYDKTGVLELAQGLHDAGVELVSTGNTAKQIHEAGIPVTRVEDVTGFPECLDGRVKTLHPRIHAGLLADLTNPEHERQLQELNIPPFDVLVSNLYPFTQTVASGADFAGCIEQIDIGGPAMLRAAAKNHACLAVITNPDQYTDLMKAAQGDGFTGAQRRRFAAMTFAHTASYDTAVASWLSEHTTDDAQFDTWLGASWQLGSVLRYGENPHQTAALYTSGGSGVAAAEQVNGKEMSYNNYVDTDAAVRAAYAHTDPCVAIIKHANPCGIGTGDTIAAAYDKALACDPVSAFGGIVATNRPVSADMASKVTGVFTEVVAAPAFSDEALSVLTAKKNLRLLIVTPDKADARQLRPISGGVLVQDTDRGDAVLDGPDGGDDPSRWRLVSGDAADDATLADLDFAWRAVRAVKSNAILLAKDNASVGVGMGQVNRVDSCHLAVNRAGADRAAGSVAASDAFFPFADGLKVLLDAGVKAVVAPGGSMRDEEVIAAAREAGVTLYFTGTRHFTH